MSVEAYTNLLTADSLAEAAEAAAEFRETALHKVAVWRAERAASGTADFAMATVIPMGAYETDGEIVPLEWSRIGPVVVVNNADPSSPHVRDLQLEARTQQEIKSRMSNLEGVNYPIHYVDHPSHMKTPSVRRGRHELLMRGEIDIKDANVLVADADTIPLDADLYKRRMQLASLGVRSKDAGAPLSLNSGATVFYGEREQELVDGRYVPIPGTHPIRMQGARTASLYGGQLLQRLKDSNLTRGLGHARMYAYGNLIEPRGQQAWELHQRLVDEVWAREDVMHADTNSFMGGVEVQVADAVAITDSGTRKPLSVLIDRNRFNSEGEQAGIIDRYDVVGTIPYIGHVARQPYHQAAEDYVYPKDHPNAQEYVEGLKLTIAPIPTPPNKPQQ